MGRIVGLEIFDDEVLTTAESAEVKEEESKKSGKKK